MVKKILLFTLMSTCAASAMVQPVEKQEVVICDLGGVFFDLTYFSLFKPNYASHIGLGNIAKYFLLDWKNPFKEIEPKYFHVLSEVALEKANLKEEPDFKRTCTSKGVRLPYLLCAYQSGKIDSETALSLALESLEKLNEQKYFTSDRERDIIRAAIVASLDPKIHGEFTQPIDGGVEILKELAAQKIAPDGTIRRLAAFSNGDKKSIELVKVRHPRIFELFDDIFISGELGTIKPNAAAFEKVIAALKQKYHIETKDCYFVDDQRENTEAAIAFGLDSEKVYHLKKGDNTGFREWLEQRKLLPVKDTPPSKINTKVVVGTALIIAGVAWIAHQGGLF